MCPDPDDRELDQSLRRVGDVLASLGPDDFERHDPPIDLWDRIASSLTTPEPFAPPVIVPEPNEPRPTGTPRAGAEPSTPAPANLDAARAERRRPAFIVLAAAAALVVVAAAGVVIFRDDAPQSEVLATATLEVLEGPATAEAQLLRVDGEDRLVVEASDMPPAPDGSHYELWLVDPEVTDPRSLGPMTGSTEVSVPSSIDPDEFPVVDISLQPDGMEQHSGRSLLRGTLN
jgi:hypothetical protein